MKTLRLSPSVVQISLGMVNVFLVEADDGLVLVDTGMEEDGAQILEALRRLGHGPTEVRHIVLTHCHADHTRGAAAIQQATGAEVWMSAEDAAMLSRGLARRPVEAGAGFINAAAFRLFRLAQGAAGARASFVRSVAVDHVVEDGDEVAGGLLAVASPGHTRGHVAYLWPRDGGVLFIGDAASHLVVLGTSAINEDTAQAEQSLARLGALVFGVAAFAHGCPLEIQAAASLRDKWGAA